MSDSLPPIPPPEPEAPSDAGLGPGLGEASPMPAPPGGRKRGRVIALAVVIALLVVAGGASAAVFAMRGSGEELMGEVPAGADIVVTGYLDPAASQKLNLVRIEGRFPSAGSQSDLMNGLNEALDQALASSGLNHNDLSWIGSQVALEVNFQSAGIPNGALLIAVDDTDGAARTLQTLRASSPGLGTWHETDYRGVTVSSVAGPGQGFGDTAAYAIVGHSVVLGSSTQAVDDVIDTDQGGASLQDSADFQATMAGLPQARLAMAYLDPQQLLDALRRQIPFGQTLPGASFQTIGGSAGAERGMGMTLSAEGDGLAIDTNVVYDSSKLTDEAMAQMDAPAVPNTLTDMVPASAYGVMFLQHIDTSMREAAGQLGTSAPDVAAELTKVGITGPDGLLESLTGDAVVEMLPGSDGLVVDGALVVGSTDDSKMQTALDHLRSFTAAPPSQTCSVSVTGQSPGHLHCHTTPAPKWETKQYEGSTITYQPPAGSGDPEPAYAVVDGVGILGTSVSAVEAVIDTHVGGNDITTSQTYRDAMAKVPTETGLMFLDVQGLISDLAAAAPADVQQSLEAFKPITAVVVGSDTDSAHQHVRILIEIP